MGIFIDLYIGEDVTDEEWAPVYAESLRLAEAFHLMDSEVLKLYGHDLVCGIPTGKKGCEKGWRTVGDSHTMERAEEQALPARLSSPENGRAADRRSMRKTASDPLLAAASGRSVLDWQDSRCGGIRHFWGNKTQGAAYHIYLLAIGCMIEDRLEGRACVDGDITLGQCRRAVRMATRYLDRPVRLPARCVPERLYKRIRALPLKKQEVLNVYHNLYLGVPDAGYGKYVREHFSKEEQAFFWKREFRDLRIGSPGFSSALRDFLNLGNSLEDLCRYVQFVDRDGTEYYKPFVEELMRSKLFLKKKDLRDCLEINREEEAPYSIYTLLAQFALSGAKNYSVNRYIPPDEIRETLERFIGGYCDVGGIMGDFLKRAAKQEEPAVMLNDLMEQKLETIRKQQEEYDICSFRELLYYEPGDRIEPGVEEHCLKFLSFYKSLCEEECFEKLMKGTAEERNAFLVYQNVDVFLMEERWRRIFTEMEDCPERFSRYYPMVRIQGDENGKWVICAYVMNDALYQYFEDRMKDRAFEGKGKS